MIARPPRACAECGAPTGPDRVVTVTARRLKDGRIELAQVAKCRACAAKKED